MAIPDGLWSDGDQGTVDRLNSCLVQFDTKANIDGASRQKGVFYFATDENILYYDDGSAVQAMMPQTTKGDIIAHDGTKIDRLAIGANDTVLAAASGEALGVKWDTRARIATGLYTGDGTTSQALTGLGFTPKYVKIWQDGLGATESHETITQMIPDAAEHTAGVHSTVANAIISLDTDGFTVDDNGDDGHPNKNAQSYVFVAIG